MGSRSRARRGARGAAGSWRTGLAAAAAAACVAASAAGGSSPAITSAQPTGPAGSSGSSAPLASRSVRAELAAFADPAAPIQTASSALASEQAATLGGTVDVGPSWTGVVPRAARSGDRAVRHLTAEVLEGRAPADIPSSALGIPGPVLAAYRQAAADMARTDPSCGVPWWLLAGIGRIESGHASGGRVDANGTTIGRILGPRLDGSMAGNAVIRDSDGGVFDGDAHYDRAVGPMQFLPSTWASVRSDGNGDGVADPNNIYDATLGAARYLCQGGADLRTSSGLAAAVLRYNYSMDYVRSVLGWGQAYRDGDVAPTTSLPGRVPSSTTPRQAPDEPPQRPARSRRHATPGETVSRPSTPATKPPAKTSPAKKSPAKHDAPPVLADGPSRTGSDGSRAPESASQPAPSPSSTVAPGNGGSSDKGTSSRPDTPASSKPSGAKPTTPPASTDPSPSKTPTTPPTTGTPTTPPTTQNPPTPAPAGAGEVWALDTAPATNLGEPATLTTPSGDYTVEHAVLADDATVDRGGTATKADKDQRLWVVKVAVPDGSTASLQVKDGESLTLEGAGAHYVAASAPEGGTISLTVRTDDGTWTLDVGTGATTTTWAHTADVAADAHLATAAATQDDYTAQLQGLQLLQAHRTSWEPGYGTAPEGTQWLVVPYTVDSAVIAPKGYSQSTWASSGLTASTADGPVPAVASDGATPASLSSEGGTLVFKVPSGTASTQVAVTPEVTVVKDGAKASDKPLALAPHLSTELQFG